MTRRQGAIAAQGMAIMIDKKVDMFSSKNIAVIDRVSAMGSFGPLYEEVLAAMNYGGIKANAYSFVAGLGGRDIWEQTVENVIDKAEALGAKQEPCEAPIWIDLKEEEVVYNA